MTILRWTSSAVMGLSSLFLAQAAQAQQAAPPVQQPGQAAATQKPVADLPGPIDSWQDVQDTGKILFKLADTNNDGQISQKEAVDAGNLLVGGFFFRADQNGDGTLTKEEARQAREALLQQQPLLRLVIQRSKRAAQQEGVAAADPTKGKPVGTENPTADIGRLLDANNDQKLEASEVRNAVQTGVQGMFAAADTNRDNLLSPTEINAAIIGLGRAAMQTAFQQADTDQNGQVSKAEFDKAIIQPANILFGVVDANGDGQLSQEEMQGAMRVVASQVRMLRVPEPANSAGNLIRTGLRPEQVAPVPNVATPGTAPRPR